MDLVTEEGNVIKEDQWKKIALISEIARGLGE